MQRLLIIFITIGIAACSSAPTTPPKPPPTFDELAAEIAACDKVEVLEKPSPCTIKKFRLFLDVKTQAPNYPKYRGKTTKDVIDYLKQAKEDGHVAAHYYYSLHLVGQGDPQAYEVALKTRELYKSIDIKKQSVHDISSIKPAYGRAESPEQEIERLIQRAEILDLEKGRRLSQEEIWGRLQPLVSTQDGQTYYSRDIPGIGSNKFVRRYLIHSPRDYYSLFVRAAELGVPEAIYHLAKVHFSRGSTEFLNTTPMEDYNTYQKYMSLAQSLNYPEALMDKHYMLKFQRDLIQRRKLSEIAMIDVKKAVDLGHPPALAVWGRHLKEKYTIEKNTNEKEKLKAEALQYLLMAKRAGEKDLDKDILFLQDEKTFLAQEKKAIEAWEERNRQAEIHREKAKQKNQQILNMLYSGVTTQKEVDYICANTVRAPQGKGDNCTWAQQQLADRGLQRLRQQNAASSGEWQGFTYTKETTDRYNKTIREGNEKRQMDQFKRDLDYKIKSK